MRTTDLQGCTCAYGVHIVSGNGGLHQCEGHVDTAAVGHRQFEVTLSGRLGNGYGVCLFSVDDVLVVCDGILTFGICKYNISHKIHILTVNLQGLTCLYRIRSCYAICRLHSSQSTHRNLYARLADKQDVTVRSLSWQGERYAFSVVGNLEVADAYTTNGNISNDIEICTCDGNGLTCLGSYVAQCFGCVTPLNVANCRSANFNSFFSLNDLILNLVLVNNGQVSSI